MSDERDDMLDRNLSRLLRDGAESPHLDPARRADMLQALRARQAEIRHKKETVMATSPWRARLIIIAVAAAAVLALWFGIPHLLPEPAKQADWPVIYGPKSGEGGIVTRTLPDGTIVISRPGTKYAVGRDSRYIWLTEGDVYLIVAKGKVPFSVHTDHGVATAHGTRFAASLADEALRVAVAQGTVTVSNDLGKVDVGVGQEAVSPSDEVPRRAPAPRISYIISWARSALAQAERLVGTTQETGTLVAKDPWGQEVKLTLREYHVDVHIEDGVARTTVDQTFFNHMPSNIEGTFYFPLPPGASVSRLAMYVAGTLNEGGMVERSRGQQIYNEIKFQRRDPALLEMMEGNVFKLRIFPIEGRQEKRIFISYTQKLEELYGTMRYWFPMDHTHSNARLLTLRLRGKGMFAKYDAHSSTHDFDAYDDGGDLVLEHEMKDVKPDQDLLVHFVPKGQERPASVATAEKDGFRYLFTRLAPALPGTMEPAPRSWVVLNDVSASRLKLDVQAQAHILERLLVEADDYDTVALVNLDVAAHPQGDGFVPLRDDAARKRLVTAARVDLPLGGTNLAAGLEAAAKLISEHNAENPHIVYLGDGVATDGRTSVDELLARLPKGATFVAVGVGKKADSTLLQAAADATGGMFTLINPDEDIDWRVFDLVAALNTPRLVGLTCEFDTDVVAYPSTRSLADGETLFVVGRTKGERPARMTLRGRVAGQDFERIVHLDDARSGAGYIPRFWASRHIESLLKDGPEHRDEIVRLAKQYYVMTPYTSLIVLENDKMYEEFKVERGRKDHWALYPAPKTIEVVKEPLDRSQWSWWGYWESEDGKVQAKTDPQTIQEIVDSVQFRINAPFYFWQPQPHGTGRFALYNLLESKEDASGFVAAVVHLGARVSGKVAEERAGEPAAQTRPVPDGKYGKRMPLSVVSGNTMAGEMLPSAFFEWTRGERVTARFFMPRRELLYLTDGKKLATEHYSLPGGLSGSGWADFNGDGIFRQGEAFGTYYMNRHMLLGDLTEEFAGTTSLNGRLRHQFGLRRFEERFSVDYDFADIPISDNFVLGRGTRARGWFRQLPGLGLVSNETDSAVPPQLGMGLQKALGERFGRIEKDIRRHNRMYGYRNTWDSYSWGMQSLDLTKTYGRGRFGGLEGLVRGEPEPGGDGEDESVLALNLFSETELGTIATTAIATTYLVTYDTAVKAVPGTTGALTVDFVLPRVEQLVASTRTTREDAELRFLRSSLENVQFAYPHLENTGLFWGYQGWNYRPQPWTLQVPQVQAYVGYNWTFDLTRYAPGLYSTTFDVVDLVAQKFDAPPRGVVSDEAAAAIAAARDAVQPVRVITGEGEPDLLVGKGDRFALTRTTDMYLEERFVCDGTHVVQIYSELGLAARRPATGLRRAALRQAVPHLIAPGDWLARSYDIALAEQQADRFVLELSPVSVGDDDEAPDVRLLVTVTSDGRILSKTLRVDGKARLTLTYTYEGGRVKAAWTTPDGKTHEGAEMRAEPFTPDADTFRADTTGLTVIDMPLRRPAYYEGKLRELKGAGSHVFARLLRHLALSHLQDLNWRRWGGHNPKAIEAMNKAAAARGKGPDGALRLTLGDLTLAGSAGRHDMVTKWAKEAAVSDATPVVAYYAKRRHGWQKPAELRDSVRTGLIGHLVAYHAAIATDKDIEPIRALIRDFGRSPLLYAAAAWRGHGHVERLFELFDQPRWQLLATITAAQWAKTDAHRDRLAEGFAKMHAELAEDGVELPVPSNIVTCLKRGDGARWKAVLAGARKVALDAKHIAPLLRFAELAMRNGESDAADEAIARATELAGDGRPLLLKLTLAQAYWAGNRQKDALRLYEEILAALEDKGVPPSSVLLAAAARLAQQAGDMGKAIDYEERALVLEHEHLPELINLQAFRQRYQWLWARYQEKVRQTAQAGDVDEAGAWLERAEAMWRRWFDVDPENRNIVSQMATLQMTADRPETAWLYLSTLIDAKPKDAATFVHLAQWHLGRKEHAKAADYYAQAFTWDTANPQWLYEQGKVLRDMGRKADSDRVLDQVINGKWAPGLERYKQRAKKLKEQK